MIWPPPIHLSNGQAAAAAHSRLSESRAVTMDIPEGMFLLLALAWRQKDSPMRMRTREPFAIVATILRSDPPAGQVPSPLGRPQHRVGVLGPTPEGREAETIGRDLVDDQLQRLPESERPRLPPIIKFASRGPLKMRPLRRLTD
jgi:hypothetical protein